MSFGRLVTAALLTIAMSAGVSGASAHSGAGGMARAKSTPMIFGQQVMPPIGYIAFCIRNVLDCGGGTDNPETMRLTTARWQELNEINDHVNAMPQAEDIDLFQQTEYWAYPTAERGGDCEDLALEKRRLLIEQGWPASALLMAVAREKNGSGHAVLIVVTHQGDYVLDNKDRRILPWKDTPYLWVKRQSRERPYVWVNLDRKTFQLDANAAMPPLNAEAPFLRYARLATEILSGRQSATSAEGETAALRPGFEALPAKATPRQTIGDLR